MGISFGPKITLNPDIIERLVTLGKTALESNDVPVAALLIYDGAVIGEGYNTVLWDGNAAGHAEINAITAALQSIGHDRFLSLDRSKLMLISTFEPCLMCVGAILNHNIRTVCYLQEKNFDERMMERKKLAKYYLLRRQAHHNNEQIELFRLHPEYKNQPNAK
ncbi:MAG: deaminase [Bacteroidota bacterium]